MEFLTNNLNLLVGGGVSGVVLWIFKRIPNDKLYAWVENASYCAGVALTLGLSKWRLSKGLWNRHIEPWFVDLLENTVSAAVSGIVKGLKSDN